MKLFLIGVAIGIVSFVWIFRNELVFLYYTRIF